MRTWGLIAAAALFLSAAWAQTSFQYYYDGNGQLFRVLDSSGNLVEYDYDASGNPTQIRRSTVAPSSLAVLNIVPQRGGAGTTVTIYGQNFSSTAAGDTVMFNGVAATVVSASSTALVVTVPSGVTTGPVSVTVGGNTATSGTLNFTVPGVPVITSISPITGYAGETLTVTVQGSGLSHASYTFAGAGPIGVGNLSVSNDTQASFTATIGQVGGVFVLVGTGDNGPGSSVPTTGNTFRVYEPPGDNFVSVRLAVFNTYLAPGSEPGVPAGSNAASQSLSVFNSYLATGNEPGVPPGSNAASQRLAVFNTFVPTGVEPGVPAGSNAANQRLAVYNSYLPPGTTPGVPAGSNYAFELLAANNTASGAAPTPMIRILPSLRTANGAAGESAGSSLTTAMAGQTMEIAIGSPVGFLPGLQFRVNGAVLASSANGYLKTWFTVPYGVKSVTLQATAQDAYGQELDSAPQQISVAPDGGVPLGGRALDAGGRARANTPLEWQADGLTVDYYQFNRQLSEVPDLTGLQPVRTGYVSALNFPNPQQVFGQDPMGSGMGQNYAARFHGKLIVTAAGDYQFQLNAQSGARLRIDGATVANGAATPLTAGIHDVEAVYYAAGSGESVQLLWTPPGSIQEAVPPTAFRTAASNLEAGTDGRFLVSVPAALSGMQVSVVDGQGSIVLDQ